MLWINGNCILNGFDFLWFLDGKVKCEGKKERLWKKRGLRKWF